MATEKMVWELVIELDKSSIQRVQAGLDVFARDTGKKLDWVRLDKLSKDFADLQIAKQRLDAEFRKNQKLYSSGLIDTNKLRQSKEALNAISSATTEAGRRLQNFKNTGDENLSRLQKKFNDVGSAWMFVKNTIIGIGSAIASYLSVSKLVELSNTFTSMENKVKQIAEWDAIPALQQRIFEMAQSSRAPVDELTSAFVRFDLVNKQLGGSQEETAIMLDTLSKGLALSWATAAETWSVMLQLSQAFGSGKLAGDEFRSIAEAMPSLLDILAKQLWVNRGALKDMASEGLITSEVLKTALLEANEQVNASFEKSSVTIGQAMTLAMNQLIMKFGELDKKYAITEKMVTGINFLSDAFFWLLQKGTEAIVWLNFWFALLSNWLKKTQIRFEGGMNVIWKIVSETFSFIWRNASILGENIGRAFDMIPWAIWMALDNGITKIENFLNKAIDWVNQFAKRLWFDGVFDSVTLGRVWGDTTALQQGFKSFEKFNTASIQSEKERTQRLIGIQDEALKATAIRLDARNNLINEADTELRGATDVPQFSPTGGGSWVKKGIDAEKEALKKLEEDKKQQAEAEERRNKWRIEQVNDLKEEQKAYIDEFVKWAEEAQKEQEKLTNEIEKTNEAIAKLEEALADLESERVTTLGDRAVQIAEERKKLEAEIIKLQNEWVTGTSLDLETLRKIGSGEVAGGDVEKLIQLKEAQAEINKLLEEEALIKANATEDELKEWVRQAELSPTARFLEEFEKKKQALEEDKILKQQELASYQTQLTEQTNAYNNFVQAKTLLEEQYSEKIKTIEASITQSITYENQKRITSLKAVERQAIATANALRRAGSGGSTSSSSSTTNNTINNSPNVVVNAKVGSSVDIQSLGNELANSVSLGSKGIY